MLGASSLPAVMLQQDDRLRLPPQARVDQGTPRCRVRSLPHGRPTKTNRSSRTRAGLPRSTCARPGRGGCRLDPGRGGVHAAGQLPPAAACRFSAASPAPRCRIHLPGAHLDAPERRAIRQGRIAAEPDGDGDGDEDGRWRKGRVPARRIRVKADDGKVLDIAHRPPADAPPVRVQGIREIGGFCFDRCSICLVPGPDSSEHVPPASLGGTVRTRVCGRCNNELGSRIEVDLFDWRDGAVRNARASADSAPGRRRLERVLYRTAPDGQFVLVLDGRVDGAFRTRRVGRIRLRLLAARSRALPAGRTQARLPRGVPRPAGDARHSVGTGDPPGPRRDSRHARGRAIPVVRVRQEPPADAFLLAARRAVARSVPGRHRKGRRVPGGVDLVRGHLLRAPWPMPDLLPAV